MTFERDVFLREAIQTPSHDGVTEIRSLLVETLKREGHNPDVDEVGNVLATRGDPTDNTHIVLNTHMDTVGPYIPYAQDGDIVRGRGACDAKGPLAAFIDAFCSASLATGRLTLAISPDEETSQFGGAYLGETLSADGYIVGEPTGLDVCHAARGGYGGRITITGESAHASNPTSGKNPIRAVEQVLEALKEYDERCGPGEHDILGIPTLTPTHIEGGGTLNQIPDECTISFDRRPVPPETSHEFVSDLEAYLTELLSNEFKVDVHAAYPDSPNPDAFVTDSDAELVQVLAEASGGKIRSFEAATEASYFADDGPTVVFGPGVLADKDGPVAHAEREYVHQSDIKAAAEAVQSGIETVVS